ncbi:hypothetical protein AHAS_Ahas05G0069100 [Arachis hypogaea]
MTSPTKSIHFHVFDNITSNSDNVHDILKTKSHNYSKGTHRVLHSFFFGVQVGRQLRPRIQAITTSNVAVATHMKTEVITEHWFGEEVKGSDWSGGQCGHGDVRAEEEGDGNDDDES